MSSGDDSGLDDLLAFFEGLEHDLSHPEVFFAHHVDRYLEIARTLTVQALALQCPPNTEPEAWHDRAREFAELVFSRRTGSGIEIVFSGRTDFAKETAGAANPGNFTPVSYQDVLDWVTAGAENGGKDITALESARERSPEQIAYDVYGAIRQHRLGLEKSDFSRITERLEEWVNTRGMPGDLDIMLGAVLDAWFGSLGPIIERDFEDWIEFDVL